MAAYHAISNSGEVIGTTTSWSHGAPSSNINVPIYVAVFINAARTATVTYDNKKLEQIAIDTASGGRLILFERVNPSTGSNTVEVTLSASATFIAFAMTFEEVSEANSVEAVVTDDGSGITDDPTIDITTLTDNALVVDFCLANAFAGDITVGSGQTERANEEYGTGLGESRAGISTEPKATAGTVTMDWSLSISQGTWVMIAIALRTAPGRAKTITS